MHKNFTSDSLVQRRSMLITCCEQFIWQGREEAQQRGVEKYVIFWGSYSPTVFIYSSNKEENNHFRPKKYNFNRKKITSNQIYLEFTQLYFNIISITVYSFIIHCIFCRSRRVLDIYHIGLWEAYSYCSTRFWFFISVVKLHVNTVFGKTTERFVVPSWTIA